MRLEFRAGAQKFLVFLVGAESHHPFHPGPVVPAAVKEDHLTGSRQMRHIALKIPLGFLFLGGGTQRNHPGKARIQAFGDAFDRAALPGGIATFEQDNNLQTL